jgi:hypothetical protein
VLEGAWMFEDFEKNFIGVVMLDSCTFIFSSYFKNYFCVDKAGGIAYEY